MTVLFVKSLLFLLGLCLGSFCNVVIHRSISENSHPFSFWSRSRCPNCAAPIGWYDLIPVVSFLLLRGRCRFCAYTIAHRYWVVELFMGFICLGLYPLLLWGNTEGFILSLVVAMGLITLFFTDLEKGLLPDQIQIPIFFFLLFGTAWIDPHPLPRLFSGFIAATLGWIIIWSINRMYFIWRGQYGFGGGDSKMMAWLGVFYGWRSLLGIFFLAALLGTLWGVVIKIQRQTPWNMKLPFGSFLAISAGIISLWGESLWRLYLELVIS